MGGDNPYRLAIDFAIADTNIKKNDHSIGIVVFFGAAGRGRTVTVSLPPDFESGASANSTTAANVNYNSISLIIKKSKTVFEKNRIFLVI